MDCSRHASGGSELTQKQAWIEFSDVLFGGLSDGTTSVSLHNIIFTQAELQAVGKGCSTRNRAKQRASITVLSAHEAVTNYL